jgi:hypothetical protein
MKVNMIAIEIERISGKNLPTSYKQLQSSITDFEEIDGRTSADPDMRVSWFFWGNERLAEIIRMDGAADRPAWKVVASCAELDAKCRGRGFVPSDDGNISFERLGASVAIAEDNGDYLYFDSMDGFSLWVYFHDSGEVRKVADSFDEWLRDAVRG